MYRLATHGKSCGIFFRISAFSESSVSPTVPLSQHEIRVSARTRQAWTEKSAQLNQSNQRAELEIAGHFPS